MPIARGDLLRRLVEHGRLLAIRNDQLAGLVQAVEGRAFLDRQLVERQVIDGIGDRFLQFLLPFLDRLVRAGIDQVEGHAREDVARQPDRLQRICDIVQPAEEFQVPVVQRLDAERHAVDAGRAIAAEARRLDARRIGLHGDLDAVRHMPVLRDAVEHGLDRCRIHQRRRAAAHEDAGDRLRAGHLAHLGHLGQEGGDEARLIDRLMPDMAVEIAIGAFGRAEGPMHIDPEAGLAAIGQKRRIAAILRIGIFTNRPYASRQVSTKSLKARARCDRACGSPCFQPCFSSALISPKVMS